MQISARVLTAIVLATCAAMFGLLSLAAGGSPGSANTPIQHLVVIFDENNSFDHYFGTYPNATNPAGEPNFTAAGGTPTPNNYVSHPNLLLTGVGNNPNSAAPVRLDRSAAVTCDQNHGYAAEQKAYDGGLADKFVQFTQGGGCTSPTLVMDYYDGNTVTALWNLAQHGALADNFFDTTFGPSTPGAINLISGNTSGATPLSATGDMSGTLTGDPDPAGDDCGSGGATMGNAPNIGTLMNTAGMTWGWFQGGFKPTSSPAGKAVCGSTHANAAGAIVGDYSAHHEPFQYFTATANPHHLPPTSVAAIGTTDQANHQYDLTDWDAEVQSGTLPQVSFLKAASFEDAHPGNSGPIDEQRWIARVLDELQQSPDWANTAVVITYDDSDGWYDHVSPTIVNHSQLGSDDTICNGAAPGLGGTPDRCGYGPRLPMLVISPWAKQNVIDSTQLDQTSIMKFIENNWNLPGIPNSYDSIAGDMSGMFDFAGLGNAPKVYLDQNTGEVLGGPPSGVSASPGINPPATTTTTTTTSPPPPGPTTTTTAPTTPKPPTKPTVTKFAPKLSLSFKKSSKSIKLTLKVTGLSTKSGSITVSLKLTKGKKTIASGHGTVHSGKVVVTIKSHHKITKGTYTLTTTVTQAHKSKHFTKTLKLH
jgi:phospholipase C